jgi:hypothetical protein
MFSTPPRTLNPLVTDIENLASSYFLKIAALFAKLQRLARVGPPANASSCALAWKLAKAQLPRVSPNQIGHSADDKDDEGNQTHLKRSVLERDAYLHCAQCCYVMIDRKASVQLTCETESGPSGAKTAVALLHYALVTRKSQQIRKRLHSRLRLSVLSSGQTAPRDGRLGHNDVFTIGCPRSGSNLSVPRGIFAPGSQ